MVVCFHHKRVAKMSQNLLEGSQKYFGRVAKMRQNILEGVCMCMCVCAVYQFIVDKLFLSSDELILYICLPRRA